MLDIAEVVTDGETGTLRHGAGIRVPWEIAMHRTDAGGHTRALLLWVEDFDPSLSDPKSLEMNGFWSRHPRWKRRNTPSYEPPRTPGLDVTVSMVLEREVAALVFNWTRDSVLAACNTSFDPPMLADMLARHGYPPMWHYSPLDITSWCAGTLGMEGRMSTSRIAAAFGFTREELGGDHSALGDVLYALKLRDLARERLAQQAARTHGATMGAAPA